MGRITSSVGLISGINSSQIIDQLVSLESAPVTQLQKQVATNNAQKAAYTDLLTQLQTLKTVGDTLSNSNTFAASTANSSDESVLTATAGNNAAIGSYQFQVAQLVSSQQSVTKGFSDPNQTKIGAGTITISEGGGELNTPTALSSLNGGQGISRGQFRITDRSGHSATIDISSAVTIDDVAKKINNSLDVSVKATVGKNGLVLTDLTGQTTGNLTVNDLGDGTAAAELGIAGTAAGNTLTGKAINTVGRDTALSTINDGRGVGVANSGADMAVTGSDGTTFNVSLATAHTVGDVIDAINAGSNGGSVAADLAPDGSGIRLTDSGGGTITVVGLNGSSAVNDLGIAGNAVGTMTGKALGGALDTTSIGSLNGGSGLALGTIQITDRTGNSANVDLSGATSVQDLIDTINGAGVGVKAALNSAGDGLQLTDTTGGSKALTVADVDSTTAASLGLAGSYTTATSVVQGANLHRQFISASTQLEDMNGGKGIGTGSFTLTSSTGETADIDLSSGNFVTLGDVIKTINARGIGVTASINKDGNGLLLTDTAGGAGSLTVTNGTGTTAQDLNLVAAGQTTAKAAAGTTTIDGAYAKTITVDANDTLTSVQSKINALGFGVTATIINDGSGASPYRLSLTSNNTGTAGRFTFDAGTTNLGARNLVQAQDAAVFLGGQGSSQPLLVTSSSNQLTNVIKGVTIDLHNVSSSPVNLTVSRDTDSISAQVKGFVDDFNGIVDKLSTYTKFDSTTNQGGVLLGDGTAQAIEADLYNVYNSVVKNAGKYKVFGDIGVTITDGAKLSFDANAFASAYAGDPDSVKSLFSQTTTGLGAQISKQLTLLTDPVDGMIPLQNQTLDTRNTDAQNRITDLNTLLQQKKDRLTQQFANMETVLASLQSQQQALGSITSISAPSTKSSSSSSSSSSA